jgi:hypothetical protein
MTKRESVARTESTARLVSLETLPSFAIAPRGHHPVTTN